VLVHDQTLRSVESTALLQHAVGNADLAHVVQRCGLAQQGGVVGGHAGGQRQVLGQEAHAHDVRAGVVVPAFRCQRQQEQRLVLRVRQIRLRLAALATSKRLDRLGGTRRRVGAAALRRSKVPRRARGQRRSIHVSSITFINLMINRHSRIFGKIPRMCMSLSQSGS